MLKVEEWTVSSLALDISKVATWRCSEQISVIAGMLKKVVALIQDKGGLAHRSRPFHPPSHEVHHP